MIRKFIQPVSIVLITSVIISLLFAPAESSAFQPETSHKTVVIINSATKKYYFCSTVARKIVEMQQGLMLQKKLNINAGMLFLFAPPRRVDFWMKDTFIPLDILFFDIEGRIVSITQQAQPHSTELISPTMEVYGVLEINGGLSKELKIRTGDSIWLSAIGDSHCQNAPINIGNHEKIKLLQDHR